MLPGLAPQAAQAAPTLAQIGEFSRPVYVVSPPRDIRSVFVVERGGTVRLLVDGTLRSRPFLDIRSLVSTGDGREDERGLLSIAFAPDYATSGRFYAYYVSRQPPAARAGDLVVDEFRRSATDPEIADPATRRTLIAVEHDDYANHNGGQLAFGPDAMLYAGTGDGGGGGDPLGSGQSLGTRLGKLLRLDIRPGAPLAPADNPFGAAAPEVWSLGLRNPFRFSFDRLTGDLTIGDVGQNDVEEIDYVPRAAGLGQGRQLRLEHRRGQHALRRRPAHPPRRAARRLRRARHPEAPLGRLVLDHRRLRGPRPRPARALRPLRLRRLLQGRALVRRAEPAGRDGRRGDGSARQRAQLIGRGRLRAPLRHVDRRPRLPPRDHGRMRGAGAAPLRHDRRRRPAPRRRGQDQAPDPPAGAQAPARPGEGLPRRARGLQRALPGAGLGQAAAAERRQARDPACARGAPWPPTRA